MSDVTQVEVEPSKVAFVSRPYSKDEKLKKDEEELEQLLEEQKQDASTEEVEVNLLLLKKKHLRKDIQIYVGISRNRQKN